MAFRKKAEFILAYNPDILIVPECEHPDKLIFDNNTPKPASVLWHGTNRNKGLGVYSYNDHTLKLLRTHNPELKLIIPVLVTKGALKLTLYAIWAHNPGDPDGQYVEQIWKAIHHYDKHIKKENTILTGDFNSNTIWDRKYRAGNHTNVVKRLESKKIYSAYHLFHKQIQGKEEDPTMYLYRHKNKPYHLDYCFLSTNLANKIESVEIGRYDYWRQFSDHVPVIVTLSDSF